MSCVHVFVCMGVTCVQGWPEFQAESSDRFALFGMLKGLLSHVPEMDEDQCECPTGPMGAMSPL